MGNLSAFAHVVVSVGGLAGMGDKLFAVPYNQVQSMPGKDYLVLSGSGDLALLAEIAHTVRPLAP